MKHHDIPLGLHSPASSDARQTLARQMARIQADAVLAYIRSLRCPTEQKLALLDAVIAAARGRETL